MKYEFWWKNQFSKAAAAAAEAREMTDRAEENFSAVTILFKFRYSYMYM